MPTTFFIDAQGKVTAQAKGAIDGETLQRGIDMITENRKRMGLSGNRWFQTGADLTHMSQICP